MAQANVHSPYTFVRAKFEPQEVADPWAVRFFDEKGTEIPYFVWDSVTWKVAREGRVDWGRRYALINHAPGNAPDVLEARGCKLAWAKAYRPELGAILAAQDEAAKCSGDSVCAALYLLRHPVPVFGKERIGLGKMQNDDPYLLVYDIKAGRHHLWNTKEATLDGKPLPNAPHCTQHSSHIDRGGRYVWVAGSGPEVSGPLIWDVEKGLVYPMAYKKVGHIVTGYGDMVNMADKWYYRLRQPHFVEQYPAQYTHAGRLKHLPSSGAGRS